MNGYNRISNNISPRLTRWLRQEISTSVRVFILLMLTVPAAAPAQQASTSMTRLEQYQEEAGRNNPEVRARYREYLAALEQVPQVKALPDPEIGFGYFISPIETRVGPQQARVELRQLLPWFGTLDIKGQAAMQSARARFEAFREARNHLFFNVHRKWNQLYQIEQNIRFLKEHLSILDTFEALALNRYEAAIVSQVDVLRVQIEKEELQTQLELLRDSRTVMTREFNELLNRPGNQPVTTTDSLELYQLPLESTGLKRAVLNRNPTLAQLDYRAESANRSIEAARKEGNPKIMFGLNYVLTGNRDAALTDNGKDAFLVQTGIRIPLYRKKYNAMERQARLEWQSAVDLRQARENRVVTQLEEALRDFYDAQRRVELYRDIQIQRTRQAIDILTEQYASADVDFEELLRMQRKLLDFQMSREKAKVDQNTAVANINYLYGANNIKPEDITYEK